MMTMSVAAAVLWLLVGAAADAIHRSIADDDSLYDAAAFVWPRPKSISHSDGEWFLRVHPESLQVTFQEQGAAWDEVHEILSQAEQRYSNLIPVAATAKQERSGVPGRVVGVVSRIDVQIQDSSTILDLSTDESYTLRINATVVRLDAKTVFGVLCGLETFAQLVEPRSGSALSAGQDQKHLASDGSLHGTRFYIQSVLIEDAPAFPYRGLLIDTARHYLPIPVIEKILDAMEGNKMNVLHWHVSDDESFPFQSQSQPSLSEGAWSHGKIYSHSDVRHIAQQAFFRGIQILPEFDSPSHSASWGVGYPAAVISCDSNDQNDSKPRNVMINPASDVTRDLVASLLREASSVFSVAELIHIGGDEVDTECLENSPDVAALMAKKNFSDIHALLVDYQQFLEDVVASDLKRTSIVWQEVFTNGLPMSNSTIVDVWKDEDGLMQSIIESGHRVVVSSCWYLDHLDNDWLQMYHCDPLGLADMTESQKNLVIGGHGSMWGEQVDETNFLSRTWPRASAVAERLWSSPDYTNNISAHDDLQDRLALQRCRLLARGIGASPIQPGICAFQ